MGHRLLISIFSASKLLGSKCLDKNIYICYDINPD